MKNIFTIQDMLENKITYYHLSAFIATLPFDRFYSELILLSLLLHTVIHITKQRLSLILSNQTLLLTSLFILAVVGLAWSQDKKQAFFDLERQLSLFLFPLLLTATGIDINRYKKNWLAIMGCTCAITILYLYADAAQIIRYFKLPLRSLFASAFINHNFSAPVGIHATYLSMYVSLSIASFCFFLLREERKIYRLLQGGVLLILLAGLIQLASRAVMIATLIFIGLFPFFISESKKKIRFIVVSCFFSLVVVLVISQIGSFKKRYVVSLKEDLTQTSVNNDILEPRVVRWHSAIQLIRQSPVIGYGTGSEKRLLKEKYFEERLYNSYLQEFNAHNQYLSFLLKYGIIGLLLFLLLLYTGFSTAFHNRDIIFCAFLLLIIITSFSENILDVNKGIFFFSFFFSLFMKSSKPFAGIFRFLSRKWFTKR